MSREISTRIDGLRIKLFKYQWAGKDAAMYNVWRFVIRAQWAIEIYRNMGGGGGKGP